MRGFLVLLFICFHVSAEAQSWPKALKKYEVTPCDGTDYLIVERKGKTGLFETKLNSFVLSPDERLLHYHPSSGFLISCWDNKTFDLYNLNVPAQLGLCQLKSAQTKLTIEFDTLGFSLGRDNYLNRRHCGKSENSLAGQKRRTLVIERYGNLLFVAEDEPSFEDWEALPLKSKEDPVMDSLQCFDSEGKLVSMWEAGLAGIDCYTVYPPPEPGSAEGYVLNLQTGEYALKKGNFAQFHRLGNYLLGLVISYRENGTIADEYYKLYQLQNDFIIPTERAEIRGNHEIPFERIFGKNVQVARDSAYVTVEENRKKGLVRLLLFHRYLNNDFTSEGGSLAPYFIYDTIIPPQYEFLEVYGLKHPTVLAKDTGDFEVYMSRENEFVKIPIPVKKEFTDYLGSDYQRYAQIDDRRFFVSGPNYKCNYPLCLSSFSWFPSGVEAELLNVKIYEDSLMTVAFSHPIEYSDAPLISIMDEYSDSLICYDAEGNIMKDPYFSYDEPAYCETVYPAPVPGSSYAEIIDLKSGKKLLDCTARKVTRTYDGFLYAEYKVDSAGLYYDSEFHLMRPDGSYLFEDIPHDDYVETGGGIDLKYRVPAYKVDSVYKIGGRSNSLTFFTEGKMGICSWFSDLIEEPADYVAYNYVLNFSISINDGNLRLKMDEQNEIFQLKKGMKMGFGEYENPTQKGNSLIAFHCDMEDKTFAAYRWQEVKVAKQNYPYPKVERLKAYIENFSLEVLTDSLIYIQNNYPDEVFDPYTREYSPEEGEVVDENSLIEKPGYSRSGIYNFVTKQWVVKPLYWQIIFMENEMILIRDIRNEKGMMTERRYSVKNQKGDTLVSNVSLDKLPEKYRKQLP